jgi:hypothetical protein
LSVPLGDSRRSPRWAPPTTGSPRAGLDRLAVELYELRCDLALADVSERMFTAAQQDRMRQRIAELKPLVGDHLDRLLATED